jgi:hypothetical protein
MNSSSSSDGPMMAFLEAQLLTRVLAGTTEGDAGVTSSPETSTYALLVSNYSLICVALVLTLGKQSSSVINNTISDRLMPVDETDSLTASTKVMSPLS